MLIVQRDDGSPKQQLAHQQQLHPQHIQTPRDSLTSGDLRAIQRPQPKKPPSKGFGAIPPPPQREPSITSTTGGVEPAPAMTTSLDPATFNSIINSTATVASYPVAVCNVTNSASNKKDQPPPPLPPPRPTQHRHTRSSSLDLNKLKLSNANAALTKQLEDQMRMPPPPEVPPRVTPTAENHPGFADFAQFPNSLAPDGTRLVSISDILPQTGSWPRGKLRIRLFPKKKKKLEVSSTFGLHKNMFMFSCKKSHVFFLFIGDFGQLGHAVALQD